MNQNNAPQAESRQRRVERYAGEFLTEPSMNAPQPIPGKPGKIPAAVKQRTQELQPVQQPTVQDAPLTYPADVMQQGWSGQYPVQPVQAQQGWSQQYSAQPAPVQQSWSQQYPVQPVQTQQGWSQQYPAQPAPVQQSWSQQYQPWQGGNGYAPPPIPPQQPPAEMPAQGSGGGRGSGTSNWWKLALLAVLLIALVSGAVVGGLSLSRQNALMQEVSAYNDRFCEGVYVDGVHLGGMTQAEAYAAVNARAQDRLASWDVSLTYKGKLVRRITAADLGMTINVNDALAEAWEQGHASSSVEERKAAMDALLETPYEGYTAMPSGDTTVIDRILHEVAAPVYHLPQDATVEFLPDHHSYPFEYTPEVYGTYLDIEPIKTQVYEMVDKMERGAIELEPQTIAPSVTEADLRRTRTLRGKATTEISTVSKAGRTANIERAFQLINGTVVKPGKTFSFNTVVGPRSQKNGFHLAIEYAYGTEREGYGGGVCQASTTLYLAAVRANMEITKREPHSDKVNYTAYGLDATVNLDGKVIDLVFKNTTASDVYVMSYLVRSNGHWVCHVDVYGEALPEGVTYDLVAETVEILQPPVDPEYIEDEDGSDVYYIDETPVQKRPATEGCVVETYKVKYINGKETERSFVARDTYKAKSLQLWVGVHEREPGWIP